MALPKLSEAQRKEALKKALDVRKKRAKLREDLKSGRMKLADVLRNADDPVVGRMKVQSLLESLPGLGKVRAQKAMDEIGISSTRRVQGLGAKQKEALLKKLS